MKRCLIAALCALFASAPINADAVSPENLDGYTGGISLQMTRPAGAVMNPGDEIGFRLDSSVDAYVIVFNIDTEGFVNLLYPARGERPVRVREGETYLIPDERSETLLVEGNTGVEFVFALAVPERDDLDRRELNFLGESNNLPREERYRIDGDPFIAANIIVGELVRGVSHREGVSLDYQYFYINDRVAYPCYLCGECDGGRTDSDCADYIITANFEETRPLGYPLRRGYEMIEPAAEPVLEEEVARSETFGEYQSDDGTVNINFYPYNSEVYYETRESLTGARDVDVYAYGWSPTWYDPWVAGWYYYPTVSVGFYWGWPSFWWGFNWGYWGGYYCSSWYWPRCYRLYDYYCYDYCYYDGGYRYRPERYKDKYRSGDFANRRTSYKDKFNTGKTGVYNTAYAQAARRDGSLKLASSSVKRSAKSAAYGKGSTSTYRTTKARGAATRRGSYKSVAKTTRVRTYGRSKTGTSTAFRHKNYTPRTRKSYGVKSSGQRTRTGTTGKTTFKPRTQRTKTNRNPAYRSGRSSPRSSSKSTYQRSGPRKSVPKSRTGSATYKGRSNSKPRSKSVTGKSRSTTRRSSRPAYKPSNRSPRSKSSSSVRSPSRSAPRSKARSSGGRARSGGKTKRKG